MIALVLLAVLALLALWTLAGLLLALVLGGVAHRRDEQVPALRITERGKWTAVLAVGILLTIGLAFATRGQVVTWDGVLTVGVPA